MTTEIRIIIALLVLLGLAVIFKYIKNGRLELKYALSWLFAGLMVLIFDLSPGLMEKMTDLLGITLPINMVFFMGFVFVLLIMFTLTVVISITATTTKRLVQENALLKKRVEELEKKDNDLKEQ